MPTRYAEHRKAFAILRSWLLGRKYYTALKALELASSWHRGRRKDGITPEFNHQVQLTMYLTTLIDSLLYPEPSLTAAILHDLPEDYPVSYEEIERLFGTQIQMAVRRLTKIKSRIRRSSAEYFAELATDPIASIVKGADRMHNSQTMVGVFTTAKQLQYMRETRREILPMLKAARRNFPEQHPAYQNVKMILVSQLEMLEHIHAGKSAPRGRRSRP